MTNIDPATLAVLENGLRNVVEEMDITTERLAFNPTMSEARDRASGIYDPITGEVVTQGLTGMPIFVGVMQFAVQAAIASGPYQDGDVVILNDPYLGGTHLMDMKLVKPFFYEGRLVAMLANTGHWTDIGGAVPGGFGVKATEVFQEGMRITPTLLYRAGELNDGVLNIMLDNMRRPDERLGDLKAQVAALNTGATRLTAFLDRYGSETVLAAIDELRERSERLMRGHLSALPDGAYEAVEYMDTDGVVDEPIKIHVQMRVEGDGVTFDFSGSSAPVRGPLNAAASATVASVYLAVKHLFPEIPINAGCFRPISVEIPETVFLNAKYPKAVSGSSAEVSCRVVDAVFSCMAQAMPDRVPAQCFGTVSNFTMSGIDPATDKTYVMFRFSGGGYGGHPLMDGLSNGSAPISASRTSQVEVLEQLYPIRFDSYALRPDSGGAGKHRGGLGVSFGIRLLRGEAVSSILADRGRFAPRGLHGGGEGAMTTVHYTVDGETFEPEHTTKAEQVRMSPGDTAFIETAGGGGYGSPAARDPQHVARDVLAGLVSPARAEADYAYVAATTDAATVEDQS
ncbi:hydantoinase B/oxoprolinase family protein [Microbacterium sp. 1.5R]|uniref:hydantoinase B/oxoprolinase family protein n=1 Tax=Microbacterium sp. 1.5R TaxID=1916917 RepID=UPI0011A24C45|nr:hydantoinase B/oxoprolinase family protein [Microbacterium sp. 1.5R]